jgi:DNA-directed RNA polymerase specialized sigma24 family protein
VVVSNRAERLSHAPPPESWRARTGTVARRRAAVGRRRHGTGSIPTGTRPRRLRKALHALPPSYRAIVFLREMEGLSTKEAADVLKVSESNVKMRLHRARLFLRKELEDQ